MKKKTVKLSARELKRYSRNMLIKEWGGEKGQIKLKSSTVLVAGAGGSGSSLLYYLAAAGVGTIRVADGDKVAMDNLNRQILHDEKRIGMNKAESAKVALSRLNSDIKIVPHPYYVTHKNIGELAKGCDIICCAADERNNHAGMKAINRFSYESGIPISWAGGVYMGGFATFIQPPKTICIECYLTTAYETAKAIKDGKIKVAETILPMVEPPNPIVGAAAGMAGALQAMETIKYLVGIDKNLLNVLLFFQIGGKGATFQQFDITKMKRPGCPYCG